MIYIGMLVLTADYFKVLTKDIFNYSEVKDIIATKQISIHQYIQLLMKKRAPFENILIVNITGHRNINLN